MISLFSRIYSENYQSFRSTRGEEMETVVHLNLSHCANFGAHGAAGSNTSRPGDVCLRLHNESERYQKEEEKELSTAFDQKYVLHNCV